MPARFKFSSRVFLVWRLASESSLVFGLGACLGRAYENNFKVIGGLFTDFEIERYLR